MVRTLRRLACDNRVSFHVGSQMGQHMGLKGTGRKWWAWLWGAAVVTVSSVSLAAEVDRWPLRSVRVEGSEHYPQEVLLKTTGLQLGSLVGPADFEAAKQRLLSTGVFETVGYRYGPSSSGPGYDVVFEVTEVRPLCEVRVEGLDVEASSLFAWIRTRDPYLGDRVAASQVVLRRYQRLVEEYLASTGHPERVRVEVAADRPGELYVLVMPGSGLPVVGAVDFLGNRAIDTGTLREAITTVAIGQRFTQGRFRDLLEATLRPMYESLGYWRVEFPTIRARPLQADRRAVEVLVEVKEGEVYKLGTIKVEAPSPVAERAMRDVRLEPGAVADIRRVQLLAERVRRRLQAAGYLEAATTIHRSFDDSARTVDLTIRAEVGPLFTFAKLEIVGLDLHGEHAVRRLWALKPGEPFDATYPDYFLKRLQELQLFDNLSQASSEIHLDTERHTVTVTLYFSASPK